jgi:hypothetical protein
VYLNRANSHIESQQLIATTAKETSTFVETLGKKCFTVGLLPKSKYFAKVLEVPNVQSQELPTMLALEAEALFPPDFGPIEISYRRLPSLRESYQKYEVYIARRNELGEYVSILQRLGINVDFILPSAVIWANLFDAGDVPDLFVASAGSDQLEAAASYRDRAVAVRTIEAGQGLDRSLVEFIRPFLDPAVPEAAPLVIGWIGTHHPIYLENRRVVFKEMNHLLPGVSETRKNDPEQNALLHVSAVALLKLGPDVAAGTANMLPRDIVLRKEKRLLYRSLAVTAASIVCTLFLVFLALKIAGARYDATSRELAGKIAAIKTEGDAVGRRIEQLKAIRAARVTRSDFYSVLAGLYEATPIEPLEVVTYSQVQLDEDGGLSLHGQAKSLSWPFLLPERLEKEAAFEEVLLKDAGQSKRGEGSIAEFRIDGKLKRQDIP